MPLTSPDSTPTDTVPIQLSEEQQVTLKHAMSGELSPSDAAAIVQELRRQNADAGPGIDAMLIYRVQHLLQVIKRAEQIQQQFKERLETLGGEPYFPASFVCPIDMPSGRRCALVEFNGSQRIVNVDEEAISLDELQGGDDIFLGNELNVVCGRMPDIPKGGELAPFARQLDDGRLVLRVPGEEEIVVCASPRLDVDELNENDLVRYSKSSHMAFEAIPSPNADDNEFFLEDIPTNEADEFADHSGQLKRVSTALQLCFDRETADLYGLHNTNILLHGPPGCGKTTLARVAVSLISKKLDEPIRVALINGAAFENPYVGVTQERISRFFRDVRAAAADHPVCVIWDEAEALGRARGGHCRHSDKFLNTLLGELDGFRENQGERIAFIFLTNRVENMDQAYYERLTNGGFEMEVNRPRMSDARDILRTKLAEAPDLPYSPNGSRESENRTRDEVIETAVSLLYSPNGPNRVCTVKTNDGADHRFRARDLISGRVLNQIAAQTRRNAASAKLEGLGTGISIDHIRDAVGEAIGKMRAAISPTNAHSYLPSLPTDLAVTAVLPDESDSEAG